MASFSFNPIRAVYHATGDRSGDKDKKHIQQSLLSVSVPDSFDWRLCEKLSPVKRHLAAYPTPPLIMAVSTMADRYKIWNRMGAVPGLSVAYAHNASVSAKLDTSTLLQCWMFLQQHGTVDYNQEGYRVREVYQLAPKVECIKREIHDHGPVTANLKVTPLEFKAYYKRLTDGGVYGEELVYHPPQHDDGVESIAVKVVGWTSKTNNIGCGYWIVCHCLLEQSYAGRHEYGKNGYFLVASGKGLENECFAALPFFIHMGVKQPTCCNAMVSEGVFDNIDVTVLECTSAMEGLTPVKLLSGKRPKKKKMFSAEVEIGDVGAVPITKEGSWVSSGGQGGGESKTPKKHAKVSGKEGGNKHVPPPLYSGNVNGAWGNCFKQQTIDCVVVGVVGLCTVLLVVAVCLPDSGNKMFKNKRNY